MKTKHLFAKVIAWFFAVLALCVTAGISVFFAAVRPVSDSKDAVSVKIRVPSGMSVKEVALELKNSGVIRSDRLFYLAARFGIFDGGRPFALKSGVYSVNASMSMGEVYGLLQSGMQEYITVSVPEGLTVSKIAALLEREGVCKASDFIRECRSSQTAAKYNIPASSLEGFLFPDTYFLIPEMDAAAVVQKMADTFFEKISEIPSLKDKSPAQLFDTVILASIVEREYRIEDEAPVIAGVFANRLRYNIGLQSCATIEYIISEINGKPHPERITYDDLKIDSPYNTYKWAGLPPGPISNPGMVALKAAADPAETPYYYFVLSDPKTGRHTFTKNFDQHRAAENIEKWQAL